MPKGRGRGGLRGRSIPDCAGLYRPRSSSLPGGTGPAGLVARRKRGAAAAAAAAARAFEKRLRRRQKVLRRRVALSCRLARRVAEPPGARRRAGLGAGRAAGGSGAGPRRWGRAAGSGASVGGPARRRGSPETHPGPFPPADPACGPQTATMVSKSDQQQLLIVVSILEGERPGTCFVQVLLPEEERRLWGP